MAATVRDVARLAGVSAMTVSRFVNDRPGVSAEARAKIEAAIAELDYAPSKVASSLISSKTQLIGMIVPEHVQHAVDDEQCQLVVDGARMVGCLASGDCRTDHDVAK